MLWPIRFYLDRVPFKRGKGLVVRRLLVPALPPPPAVFTERLRGGPTVELYFREELGLRVLLGAEIHDRDTAVLCDYVRPGTWAIDAGANIGLTALALSGVAEQVLAFEPCPKTAARLHRNLELSKAGNVRLIRKAVGSATGSVMFQESELHTLSSASVVPLYPGVSYQVPMTTLDQAWQESGCPAVSAIKLDIEGGELEALRGARRLIERERPVILLEAYFPGELEAIDALLGETGYTRHQPEGFDSFNYLFLPVRQQ